MADIKSKLTPAQRVELAMARKDVGRLSARRDEIYAEQMRLHDEDALLRKEIVALNNKVSVLTEGSL
jgi:hypothetical protein